MLPFLLLLLSTPNTCEQVHSPFEADGRSRQKLKRRIISRFGDARRSYIRGHKHSGIDIKGRFRESVRAICSGRVVDIHLGFPHRTVVVEHRRNDGTGFYSSYKHIEEIQVHVGDQVDHRTSLGRLFTRHEHKRARFGRAPVHLHFEIRKRIDDGGKASWSSMSDRELSRFFRDPQRFFRRALP